MITVISGTDRPNSMTRRVSQLVLERLQQAGEQTQLVDLTELPANLYNGQHYFNAPPEFKPFQDAILNTDGVITVTPEYNGSFPGALKYFIDMLKFPDSLRGMPSCFVGVAAGRFGALRPIEQLEMIYQYREAHLFGKRVMFPDVENKISADFKTITDDFVAELFESTISGFIDFVKKLSA